jgi:hypothetical protein
MRVVRYVFLIFRFGAALWVAVIVLFGGFQTLGYIPSSPKLDPIGWGISLGIIGLESVGAIIRDRSERSRSELQRNLDRISLLFVLEQLRDGHQSLGLAFEDLGVSVWVPTMWSRFRGRALRLPRKDFRLRRLNRFRPDDFPQSSNIPWTGDIGGIGKCWSGQREDYHDNHLLAKKWGNVEITKEQFAKIPADTRRGFSREQFSRIVGKYSELRAIPIMHSDDENGTMIGVLTIDRVYAAGQTPFIRHLDADTTLRRGVAAAALVSSTIAGKR